MAYPRKIKNFNAFVDGFGYFGRCTEAKLPDLELATSDYRGGGMDAPVKVDMGQETMQAELTFAEWSPELLRQWGRRSRFVLRGGAQGEEDFEADSIVVTLGGRVTKQGQGDFKAGDDVHLTLTIAPDYYRLEHNGDVMVEIDVEAGKRIVGGEDQLASMRLAMGL